MHFRKRSTKYLKTIKWFKDIFCFPYTHAQTHIYIHVHAHTPSHAYSQAPLNRTFLAVTLHLKAQNSNATFYYIIFYIDYSSKYTFLKINLLDIKDTIWNFFSLNTVFKVFKTLFLSSDILILFKLYIYLILKSS